MLRVVAGSAGGLRLHVPRGVDLRPTQDRIKQAIFSSLGDLILDAPVLDLFAGSGALGIEALSRGAASATFVDENPRCVQTIEANLSHCRLKGQVVRSPVEDYLNRSKCDSYRVIFADPPYRKGRQPHDVPAFLGKARDVLTNDGILVWEHAAHEGDVPLPGWQIVRHKTYGDTGVLFLRRDS